MSTNSPGRRMGSAAACVLSLLTLTISSVVASVPSSTAHYFSSHPMIAGTVVTVNDHQMVVNTDQGEQATLQLDSRTLAPRDLQPGMVMRAEFLALEDCRFYAQRIIPVRGGMSTNRLQAYANTADGREGAARRVSATEGRRAEPIGRLATNEHRPTPTRTSGEPSSGRMMTATPISADHQFSNRPMISGSVVSVNDHRLVIETDQGQRVAMVMDSRTMVPREVSPGSIVRTDFTQMKDGRYYANRVSRIGDGVPDREQAYAHTRDGDLVIARDPTDCGFVSVATGNAVTSADHARGTAVTTALVAVPDAPAPMVERPETLPQTASDQPALLLLGLSVLGSAGLVGSLRCFGTVRRGLRTAARGLRIV